MTRFAHSLGFGIVVVSLVVGCSNERRGSADASKRAQDRMQIELMEMQKSQATAGDEKAKLKAEIDAANAKIATLSAELKQAQDTRTAALASGDQATASAKASAKAQEERYNALKVERDAFREQLAVSEERSNAMSTKIADMTATAARLKSELAEVAAKVEAAAKTVVEKSTTQPTTNASMNK